MDELTIAQLASLVREMRKAQLMYFRQRSQAALNYAKGMEARVDKAVASVLDKQLF